MGDRHLKFHETRDNLTSHAFEVSGAEFGRCRLPFVTCGASFKDPLPPDRNRTSHLTHLKHRLQAA